jgi:tetrapyrrole methylase family protein / MazG family protein
MIFDEFMELRDKSTKYDPWVIDRGLHGYTDEIVKEAIEAKEASDKKDYENLKEELGDVFYDWANACMMAERENLFTMEDVIQGIIEKIKRRKPYILENRRVSKEEAVRIWNEVKGQEKYKAASSLANKQ